MPISLGNTQAKYLYLGSTKIAQAYLGNIKVYDSAPVPDNVLIFEFEDLAYDPSSTGSLSGAVWTQISSSPNVWQWDARAVQTTDWRNVFWRAFNWSPSSNGYVKIIRAGTLTIPEILGASADPWPGMFSRCYALTKVCALSFPNATVAPQLFEQCTNLTSMGGLNIPRMTSLQSAFNHCTSLPSVGPIVTTSALKNVQQMFYEDENLTVPPYFETSGVTNMKSFFYYAPWIGAVPLYHTDSATDVSYMFYSCYHAEGGALALYQQMSSQANPPDTHYRTFYRCGRSTTTGAAELAQIPSDWK